MADPYLHPTRKTISHADLAVGGAAFSVTEEAPGWNSHAPPSLGGSPVVLQLRVGDVDAIFEGMGRAGAMVVFASAWRFVQKSAERRTADDKLKRKYDWLDRYFRLRLPLWGLQP